jgi:hypothetical protein
MRSDMQKYFNPRLGAGAEETIYCGFFAAFVMLKKHALGVRTAKVGRWFVPSS